jgi:hypothetical protein
VRACAASSCVLGACEPGFEDCNGQLPDGCEAELGFDPLNCGRCGRACGGSETCELGACCVALPAGTYQASCVGCTACEGVLSCLCQDVTQALVPTSIPLDPPCPGGFTNCNGVLQCQGC